MWQKENLSTCTERLHFDSLYIVVFIGACWNVFVE